MTVGSSRYEQHEVTLEEATVDFFKRCKPVIVATAKSLGYELLYPESLSFPTRLYLQFSRGNDSRCSVECYPKSDSATGMSWWGFRCAPSYRQDHSELESAIESVLARAKIHSPVWRTNAAWG